MLGQIADHSRIVHPTPSDAYVKQRRNASEKLISDESLSVEVLEAFVEFAAFGVPTNRDERHDAATTALITAIQESQPSFPADVDANQMDLRLVASIVAGERLRTKPSDPTNVYIASLLLSALLLQPLPQQLYLARLVQDVVKLATASLAGASKELRERQPWPKKAEVEIAGTEVGAIVKSANAAFEKMLEVVTLNTNADREELDVLWWVFGGRSARTGERFESMADGERAFVAPIELSARMLMPPIPTAQHLLGALVSSETKLSLTQVIGQCQGETLTQLVRQKSAIETVLESHSSLLPLTWLASRLVASDLSSGWQPELEKKTHLKVDIPVTLGDWARQVFAECVAQRLAVSLLAEDS